MLARFITIRARSSHRRSLPRVLGVISWVSMDGPLRERFSGPRTAQGSPRSAPSAEVVHRIHDRYLLEVVEALGLCPFARRCREQGRVHRPLWWVDSSHDPEAKACARNLAERLERSPDAEIVLMSFVDLIDRFAEPDALDAFVAELRSAYEALDAPHFFMVGFHPLSGREIQADASRPLTKDSLVPLIRRSPDPVIQCVRGDILQQVRAQAQRLAHQRLIESVGDRDPVLKALIERSVQADSELSADIARHNFAAVGQDEGRRALEDTIASIRADRDRSYGWRFPGT